MNLDLIMNNILFSGANWSRKEGEKLFEKGLVSDIKGKKIDNTYHIYGKTKSENGDRFYNSHIKINTQNDKVIGVNCSCETFLENSKTNEIFRCKHIMAVAYKFNSLAKKSINNRNEESVRTSVINKRKLRLNLKLKNICEKLCNYYLIEFWIGDGSTYLINSLQDFVKSYNFNKTLNISSKFTYNPRIHELDHEAVGVLSFINSYLSNNISLKEVKKEKIQGKNLIILEEYLHRLLEVMNAGSSISLNYDFINYKSSIIKNNLPISFTLKLKDNNIVLTTKNKLPIALDSSNNVFIYDRNIYLPEREQINYYMPLYKSFLDKGEVVLKNTTENLKNIINNISRISEDISVSEGLRRKVQELIIPQFFFYKENSNIYCKMKIESDIEFKKLKLEGKKLMNVSSLGLDDKILMELEKIRFIKEDHRFIFIGEDSDIYNLLAYGISDLSKIGEVHLSDEFKEIKLIKFDDFEYYIENDGYDFYFNYKMGDFTLKELRSAMDSFKGKNNFYKTKKNNYLDLNDDGVKFILNILDSININEAKDNRFKIDKNQLLFLEQGIKNNSFKFNRDEQTINILTEKLEYRDKTKGDIPKGFIGTLRDYQVVGYNWLKEISTLGLGGILADEMGLGKTIQVISYLLSEIGKKSIIITPTSLIYNWENEFLKFVPTLKVLVVHGNKKERIKYLEDETDYDVLVTTYGTLKSDYELYREKNFDYCIIDEAQNIKNSKSQNSKYVKSINANCKIALTGTPIENNLLELWSIFDFIMPGYLLSEVKFKEKFMNSSKDNIPELNELIKPFILRRLKKEVALELPDKIEKKYYVDMPLEQKQVYKSYIKEIKNKLKKGGDDKITILSYLTKLRQICLDPSLLLDDYLGRSGKILVVKDIIKDVLVQNRKIIIFSQFTSLLKKIGEDLEAENIKYIYLDGSTKSKDRIRLVDKFNRESSVNIFLISLKAGGTGLNLTSADLVIHFDPWWNPAIEDQATDRAHRIGQKNIVEVIKLISKDTIEEKIIEMQDDKRELINKVISEDNFKSNLIGSLSNDELLNLFN